MKLPLPVERHNINLPVTDSAGSSTPLLPRRLHDHFRPAESVLEHIWIDLFHTHLAHTMTKLNL